MPFQYDISDELESLLKKMYKKNKQTYEAIMNKIDEIASRDNTTIDFYKNLQNELKEYKRVHIMKSFVLLFKVYKEKNFILFDKFSHHDEIYEKKK
ncbi:MAG TPA: addiction module toxin RelE [archaeon]|nr:addiction module toxin RelE [archaeon]